MATFEKVGFVETHLELNLDTRKAPSLPWKSFLDTAIILPRRPYAKFWRRVLREPERSHFEAALRPTVETGRLVYRDTIAYLSTVKPG